jgi:hypothetical protein
VGAHKGRPYTGGAQTSNHAGRDQTNNPAWFPSRVKSAQFVSFNFTNKLICAAGQERMLRRSEPSAKRRTPDGWKADARGTVRRIVAMIET